MPYRSMFSDVASTMSTAAWWADENGDWLRNTLYLCERAGTISCGACPPFHQSSRVVSLKAAVDARQQLQMVERASRSHPESAPVRWGFCKRSVRRL